MDKIYRGVFLLILVSPLAVAADVVWPALYLEHKMTSVPVIAVGYLVEAIGLSWIFKTTIKKAAIYSLAGNFASSLLGIILRPISGILWEIFPGLIFYKFFNVGTFNPVTWTATLILASVVNAGLESLVYRFFFNLKIGKAEFFKIVAIN